ncbi:hypothetical protein LSH36_100g08006 [Paralvinella palmiformis]|uniref:Uncharacterized protein n=1 Tax=Paralvinella palmiformis TaxID=53620 RepID=A0AAD9K0B6_9ANNE|nr:hypothetical protein LSH36_100g08006 [Paralvinella palmiformis]
MYTSFSQLPSLHNTHTLFHSHFHTPHGTYTFTEPISDCVLYQSHITYPDNLLACTYIYITSIKSNTLYISHFLTPHPVLLIRCTQHPYKIAYPVYITPCTSHVRTLGTTHKDNTISTAVKTTCIAHTTCTVNTPRTAAKTRTHPMIFQLFL